MSVDKSIQDIDLSSIPGEFRENYRFLNELISCKEKNQSVGKCFDEFLEKRLSSLRGRLNRRQIKLINDYLAYCDDEDDYGENYDQSPEPPVPVELEASIRIRKRSTWLPWEAEAIRKIDRWRADLKLINAVWTENGSNLSAKRVMVAGKKTKD